MKMPDDLTNIAKKRRKSPLTLNNEVSSKRKSDNSDGSFSSRCDESENILDIFNKYR
jgi:hypothetical protein